jgi:MFS family permease
VALIVSNTLGFGGEQMRLAAQSWWILDEGGSKTEMGLAAGLRFIPIVIITLYAGVMIDRIGGKRVLILERSFLVILSLVTAFVLFSDQVQIWHIVVLTAIAGTTIAMGYPSTQSLVPQVAPKELFQSANSMNQLGNALGRTLGPLLAGILIAIKDAAVAFIGLAVVYAVSALATFGIGTKTPLCSESGSAIGQIADGLRYIRRNPILMWVILMAYSVVFLSFFFSDHPGLRSRCTQHQ